VSALWIRRLGTRRRAERAGAAHQPPEAPRPAAARDVLGPALVQLSPDHRVVVALRFYRDLTVEQIAVLADYLTENALSGS